MSTDPVPIIDPIAVAAEALDDLLTMLGVMPGERQIEEVNGAMMEMGDDIKTTLARAAIRAYQKASTDLMLHGWHPPGTNPGVRVRPQRFGSYWSTLTVEHVSLRGGGPYQDTTDTYDVTFSGGHPSSSEGYELPFGVPRAFDEDQWKNVTSYPPKTIEERRTEHYARIKERMKGMIPGRGWEVDLTAGEPNRQGATVLVGFELVNQTKFTTTFRLVITKPNMS